MCGRRLDTRDQRRPIGDKYKDEDRPDQRAIGTRLDLHRIADLAVDDADEEFQYGLGFRRHERQSTRDRDGEGVRKAMMAQVTITGSVIAPVQRGRAPWSVAVNSSRASKAPQQ